MGSLAVREIERVPALRAATIMAWKCIVLAEMLILVLERVKVVELYFGNRFGPQGEKGRLRLREEAVESKGCRLDVARIKGPALGVLSRPMDQRLLIERHLCEWSRLE